MTDQPKALLFATGKGPLNLKCSDGSVVNVRGLADKEYEFFVIGKFDSPSDLVVNSMDHGNLLKTHPERGSVRILRMVGSGNHGFSCDGGKKHVAILDPSNPTSSEDVLSIEHGIVEQILHSASATGNQETLDHRESFCIVCEGIGVARQFARGLSAWLEKGKK